MKRGSSSVSRSRPVGIFDSGVGGLTVLRALVKVLPSEDFIYVGDTARVPYGTKSPEAVTRFSSEISRFLVRKKVKMIVVACNTASAVSMKVLRRYRVPVIGVIWPGVRAVRAVTRRRVVGIIGTPSTIGSGAYSKKLKDMRVYSKACPLFVPLVESGQVGNSVAQQVAKEYLRELVKKNIDTLVLGCTHYPLLKKVISRVVGPQVRLIDSAEETAREVERTLRKKNLMARRSRRGHLVVYSSDDPKHFAVLGRHFLGRSLPTVRRVRFNGI